MEQKRIDLSTDIKEIRKVFESCSKSGDSCRQRVENTKKLFETRIENVTNSNSCLQQHQTKENRNERPQKTTIVQLSPADENNTQTDNNSSDFNHIRYQILKSKFTDYKNNENIQLQKLLSYLNNYSLEDILNEDNNIVIIEPIRSTVEFDKSSNKKTHVAKNIQHNYFGHPIRINKELLESELPTPDTVKQVRNYFEKTTSSQHGNQRSNKPVATTATVVADLSKCQNNDKNVAQNNIESVMRKIRDQGTTVTYFGGEIVPNDNSYQIKKVATKNSTDLKFEYDLKKFQNGSQVCNEIEFEPYEVQQP